jgi:hypothetical protein
MEATTTSRPCASHSGPRTPIPSAAAVSIAESFAPLPMAATPWAPRLRTNENHSLHPVGRVGRPGRHPARMLVSGE